MLQCFDDTFIAVDEECIAALLIAGSISTLNKNLYGLQMLIPGLSVGARQLYVCKFTNEKDYSVGQCNSSLTCLQKNIRLTKME